MLSHPEPYLFAPSALGVTALRERLTCVLSSGELAAAVASGESAVRVRHNFLYDAWLVRWPAGTTFTSDAGYGAMAVLAGSVASDSEVLTAGAATAYRPGPVELAPIEAGTVTVHVASPPLARSPIAGEPVSA